MRHLSVNAQRAFDPERMGVGVGGQPLKRGMLPYPGRPSNNWVM